MAAAAASLGPFVTAFCTELGRRLGGNVADWASRVSVRRRRRSSDDAELVVAVGDVETVIEVDDGWSDDAKLALLDLDPTAVEVRGQRLRWDREAGAWRPSE